ncbi:hypothetical protein [Dubosiella newyorkensis]|uniref:Uncharacterized protein n=1 Tax=Dubosiella newyorkensis TaxID=1862672 RepID=A0A1U7NPK2_9FIRM|nr:hypothetical protein [Dubosiella newyorkensis]OLU47562.1 hypothetical protein BO225_02670 [Dubosiella newyorkensis]
MKKWIKALFYPPKKWIGLFVLVSIALFLSAHYSQNLYGITWIVFCYTLFISALASPQLIRDLFIVLNRHKWTSMFVNDVNIRIFVSLYFNMFITSLNACYDFFFGLIDQSEWLIGIAFYYGVLTAIRFYLLSYVNRYHGTYKIRGKQFLEDLKRYRATGYLLIALLVPYTLIAYFMLEKQQAYSYRGLTLYVMGLFTIYQWIMVVFGHLVYRKIDAPILTSKRALNFACSIVSLLAFETAWFSNAPFSTRQTILAFSASMGGIVIFCIAFYMVRRAHSILSLNFVPLGKDKQHFWEKIQQKKADYAEEKKRYEENLRKNWNMEEIDSKNWWHKKEK